MRRRALTLLALLMFVPVVRSQEKTKAPALVVRMKALDDLISDLRWLAEQAGRAEEAVQVEKLVKAMTGDKGLEGVDTKKPIGLYAFMGDQVVDSKVVLLVPIADRKTALETIERLGLKPKKDNDGLYELALENSPFPAYFRFANGYVYGTVQHKDVLAETALLKPEKVLPAKSTDVLSVSVELAGLPEELRKIALGQLDLRLNDVVKDKQPGETDVQHRFRKSALKDGIDFFKSVLTDEGALNLRFIVDRKAGDIALTLGLSAKDGSGLMKSLKYLGETSSAVAGIVGDDSAMATRITYALPKGLSKNFEPVIEEALAKVLESAREKEARDLLKPLLDALTPTLKQGKVDAALDFRGPSKKEQYVVVGGIGVKSGAALEKAVKTAVEKLPAEARTKISIDVDKSAGINIHRLNIEKDLDAEARKSLGESPLWFAVKDDAVLFAVGEGGLAALKDVLAVKAKNSPMMQMEVSMSRMAALMARDQKAAPMAAKEAFKKPGDDKVFISLEGGDEFRVRLNMKGAVLKFFALIDQAEKENKDKDK